MTDDLSKDEIESMIPEDNFAGEAQDIPAESWKDDPSLEDGFSDPEMMQDDFQDNLGVQEDVVEDAPENSFRGGRGGGSRGKGILVGVAAAILLFVGGFVYLQFGSDSSSSGKAALSSLVNMNDLKGAAPQQATAKAGTTDVSPTTAGTDLSLLYQAAKQQAGASGAVVLPGDEAKVPASADKESLSKSTEILLLDDMTGTSSQEGHVKEEPRIAKIENIPVKPAKVSLRKKELTTAPDPRLAEMSEKIKTLEANFDQMKRAKEEYASRLEALQKNTAFAPQEDTFKNEKIQLEARLAVRGKELKAARAEASKVKSKNKKLSKQLKAAKAKIAKAKKAPQKKKADVLAGIEKPVKLLEEKVAVAQKDTKSKDIVPKESKMTKDGKKLLPSVEVKIEPLFLRAATPDAVWVASGQTTADLKRVVVGDFLDQIGKITEIRQKDGKWEVLGTEGVLR